VSDPGFTDAPECPHDWIFVRDWYGDPNVINGTADCSFYRCRKCGEETSEEPEDFIEPEPPEDDGECFRGGEAASDETDRQAKIQRELK